MKSMFSAFTISIALCATPFAFGQNFGGYGGMGGGMGMGGAGQSPYGLNPGFQNPQTNQMMQMQMQQQQMQMQQQMMQQMFGGGQGGGQGGQGASDGGGKGAERLKEYVQKAKTEYIDKIKEDSQKQTQESAQFTEKNIALINQTATKDDSAERMKAFNDIISKATEGLAALTAVGEDGTPGDRLVSALKSAENTKNELQNKISAKQMEIAVTATQVSTKPAQTTAERVQGFNSGRAQSDPLSDIIRGTASQVDPLVSGSSATPSTANTTTYNPPPTDSAM